MRAMTNLICALTVVVSSCLLTACSTEGGDRQTCTSDCEWMDECVSSRDIGECVDHCLEYLSGGSSTCKEAFRDLADCREQAGCDVGSLCDDLQDQVYDTCP